MLKLKHKLLQQEQGFTLVEVLVAVLIVSILITTSMQAMIYSTVFKIRARQYTEATTWIQENLEFVKYQASNYSDSSKCNAASSANGYAQGFRDASASSNGLGGSPFTATKQIGNKGFQLTGTATPKNESPYNVLEINYSVSPSSGGSSVAALNTEVIPDAAFDCP